MPPEVLCFQLAPQMTHRVFAERLRSVCAEFEGFHERHDERGDMNLRRHRQRHLGCWRGRGEVFDLEFRQCLGFRDDLFLRRGRPCRAPEGGEHG